MKRILLVVSLVVVLGVSLTHLYGWGAITGFNTHGVILQAAFNLLSKDPAFNAKIFPTLDKISAHEGVYVSGEDGFITGPGPDSEGKTKYTDHYYNPQTGSGNAPGAAVRHFREIIPALQREDASAKAKDFAWGAHFTADVSVIYHAVGMDFDAFDAEYTRQKPTGKFILPTTISGDRYPLSYGMVFEHSSDFLAEAEAYRNAQAKDATVDWFDPWYWNGYLSSDKRSSHVSWEAWVRDKIDITGLGYSDNWDNPEPSFDNYLENQCTQVMKMVQGAALKTWINTRDFAKYSMPPLQEATKNVATFWRASISALSLEYDIEPSGSSPDGETKAFRISAKNIVNKATETAQKAQLRLFLSGARLIGGEPVQDIGDIPAGVAVDKGEWEIEYDDGVSIDDLTIRIELIAKYEKTPDLQYASVHVGGTDVENSIILVMDASGSMAGKKIADAKSRAVSQISRLDSKTEVALVVFSDCGNIDLVCPFLLATPVNIPRLKTAIESIRTRGSTPLAAALAFARNHMRKSARAQNQSLILLSDGEETCQGDPVAEARALNED